CRARWRGHRRNDRGRASRRSLAPRLSEAKPGEADKHRFDLGDPHSPTYRLRAVMRGEQGDLEQELLTLEVKLRHRDEHALALGGRVEARTRGPQLVGVEDQAPEIPR